MNSFLSLLIRTSAFLGKEIFEILRQPRLILTLVFGPFLILLLFGIGFRNEPRALRTMFVVEDGSEMAQRIQEYATSLGPQLIFAGITSDEAEAKSKLLQQQVDVVAVAPSNAYQTIRNSQQAIFTLYHNEIDPFQKDYVNVFGQVYVDEVNRRILQTVTQRGQSEASTVQDRLQAARTSATAIREALERDDSATAREHQRELNTQVDELALVVGASAGLLSGVQDSIGPGGDGNNLDTETVLATLTDLRQGANSLDEIEDNQADYNTEVEKVAQIEEDLTTLDTHLSEFQSIAPNVLVSPFRSEAQSISTIQFKPADFFAPSVIVLLLQHLAITFAALSIVRERVNGAMELFRVSPISAIEMLTSKYLSYIVFSGILAVILTLLVIYGLAVPMLGTWLSYGLVIAALIFTSLGIGFVISLLAQTDSQAVQYSMIVLLASVFFSGAFLALQTLWEPVRVVSWALPATYG
ncbi:MAG TPA: ABC transporter permease, partial [Anaerolineae bacterium]|nr:ABC transporter permease [Anaerolineae bacterium]